MEIMKGAQPPPRPEGQLPTRGGVLSRERLWVQHTDLTKGRKEGCAESSGRSRAQSKSHQGGLPAGGCKVLLGEAKGTRRAQPYPGHVQDSPCRVHPELSLTSPHIPPESPPATSRGGDSCPKIRKKEQVTSLRPQQGFGVQNSKHWLEFSCHLESPPGTSWQWHPEGRGR